MFGRSFKAQNASVINIVACSCVILVDISGHQSLTSLFRSDFHCSTAPPASSYDIRHKPWDHTEARRQMPPVDASRDLQELALAIEKQQMGQRQQLSLLWLSYRKINYV